MHECCRNGRLLIILPMHAAYLCRHASLGGADEWKFGLEPLADRIFLVVEVLIYHVPNIRAASWSTRTAAIIGPRVTEARREDMGT